MKPLVYRWNNNTHGSILVEEHLVRLQKFHCLICATSPKYNPRKAVYKAPKHCQWPNGPLEVWQMNFTLLPLSHVYKNVLVMVCIFSYLPRWISGKESTCNAGATGDVGSIPGLWKSPGERKGYPSSILFWKIPWTEEPDRLQSLWSQRVGHNWSNLAHTHCFFWKKLPQPRELLSDIKGIKELISLVRVHDLVTKPPPPPTTCTASPAINISHWIGMFLIIDEPTLRHHYHPK